MHLALGNAPQTLPMASVSSKLLLISGVNPGLRDAMLFMGAFVPSGSLSLGCDYLATPSF